VSLFRFLFFCSLETSSLNFSSRMTIKSYGHGTQTVRTACLRKRRTLCLTTKSCYD
jgi:hypothetical protein